MLKQTAEVVRREGVFGRAIKKQFASTKTNNSLHLWNHLFQMMRDEDDLDTLTGHRFYLSHQSFASE
jgi:hypothetical protein